MKADLISQTSKNVMLVGSYFLSGATGIDPVLLNFGWAEVHFMASITLSGTVAPLLFVHLKKHFYLEGDTVYESMLSFRATPGIEVGLHSS